MWPILLKILQILGCIIGAVIIFIILFLVIPVKYRLTGSIHNGKYDIQGRVVSIFHILRGKLSYPENFALYLKFLNLYLYPTDDDDDFDYEKYKSNDSFSDELEFKEFEKDNEEINKLHVDLSKFDGTETSKDAKNVKTKADYKDSEIQNDNEKTQTINFSSDNTGSEKDDKNNSAGKFIFNPEYYIKVLYENFRHKFISRLKFIIKEFKFYIKLLTHPDTAKLFYLFIDKIGKLLKLLIPQKAVINIKFGCDTPDTTGMIYGAILALIAGWPGTYNIEPDFENKVLDADINISGRFQLFKFIYYLYAFELSNEYMVTESRLDFHSIRSRKYKEHEKQKHEAKLKALKAEYQ